MSLKNQAFPWPDDLIQKSNNKKVVVFGQIFQIYIRASRHRTVMFDLRNVKIRLFLNLLSGC